jgi:hypothetical protein
VLCERHDGTREFDKRAIAHEFDDAASILDNQGFEHLLPTLAHCGDGPCLIGTNELAIADEIGNYDGCKMTLHILIIHVRQVSQAWWPT